MAGHRTALRLMLLVLTAIGVAGMHTLGHPSKEGHGASTAHSTVLVDHDQMAQGAAIAVTAIIIDTGAINPRLRLDLFTACLAVLGAGLIIVVLAARLAARLRRARNGSSRRRATRSAAGRGPPRRALLGLQIADLSVLRT